MFSAVWGRDPPNTNYGFEDEVRVITIILAFFTLTPVGGTDPALVISVPTGMRKLSHITLSSYFSGHKNKDVAFFHKASTTLLAADLLFNLPPYEQVNTIVGSKSSWGTSIFLVFQVQIVTRDFGTQVWAIELVPFKGDTVSRRKPRVSRYVWHIATDIICLIDRDMKRDAKTVSGWDFTRIIPCHGVCLLAMYVLENTNSPSKDVIEGDGKKAWNDAYRDFLN